MPPLRGRDYMEGVKLKRERGSRAASRPRKGEKNSEEQWIGRG